MVDEEFVQARKRAHPADSKESGWRTGSDPGDEPGEFFLLGQPDSTSLGEPSEGAGKDEARTGNNVALAQYKVGCKVLGGPAGEQRGCLTPEFVEQIAQCGTFLRVEVKVPHRVSWPGEQ